MSIAQEAIRLGRKWENIKYGKAKLDQARGATFSRLVKDLMKATKEGGPDPEGNFRLALAIDNAHAGNMPNDNIQRAIQRASGQIEGVRYEDFFYEGYGPGGVAILMNVVTENRNRTAADVRHALSKYGGNLGETGCVGWMFAKQGIVEVERTQTKLSEDDMMMLALDAGADDFTAYDDTYEITTAPEALDDVLRALEKAGIKASRGEITMTPSTTVEVSGETAEKLIKLLDVLEENDDIQNVYTNADIADEE